MKKYKPNDLNRKCEIGSFKTIKTATGGSVKSLDPDTALSVWFASKMRTLALQFQVEGTDIADTFEIVVRHNPIFTKKMGVLLDGTLYDIKNISSDESAALQKFDILTLKEKTKGA